MNQQNVLHKVGRISRCAIPLGAHFILKSFLSTSSKKIRSSATGTSGKPPTACQRSLRTSDEVMNGPRLAPFSCGVLLGRYAIAAHCLKSESVSESKLPKTTPVSGSPCAISINFGSQSGSRWWLGSVKAIQLKLALATPMFRA